MDEIFTNIIYVSVLSRQVHTTLKCYQQFDLYNMYNTILGSKSKRKNMVSG